MAKPIPERQFPPMRGLANAHSHWTEREIHELILDPEGNSWISTDSDKVDRIIPYSEPGEMGYTIWFEVRYVNGGIVRHNGSYIASVGFREIPREKIEIADLEDGK